MEKIKISYEEKEKFHKAFRQHEFRILFDEYFDEISDNKYRKEKEDYLLSLYFKGELKNDQILIQPVEAFCVKTKILYANQTNQKLFLNICAHDGIENMSFQNISNASVDIPYSLSQIRPDKYGNNISCLTIDCCINSSTVDIIRSHNEILNFLLEDICLNIEKNIMKDKEKICRDFKILSNMKCKGEKPFLLCINKNFIKKSVLIEEEKKLLNLKKEYEKKNITPNDVKQILNKSKIETEIKVNKQNEINNLNEQELSSSQEIKKQKIKENKVLIYHQGTLNTSSFFKNNKFNNISINLPNKIKVLINVNKYVTKNDISITIKKKILELKFSNGEEKLIVNLPYPCNEKDYCCILKRGKKKIEIYLDLCEEFVKNYIKNLREKYFSNEVVEENNSLNYIDDIVNNYEQRGMMEEKQTKENKLKEIEKEKNESINEIEKVRIKQFRYENCYKNEDQEVLKSDDSLVIKDNTKNGFTFLESNDYVLNEKKEKTEKEIPKENIEKDSDKILNVNNENQFLKFNVEEKLSYNSCEDSKKMEKFTKENINKNTYINKEKKITEKNSQNNKIISFDNTLSVNNPNNKLHNEKEAIFNDLKGEIISEVNLYEEKQIINKSTSLYTHENNSRNVDSNLKRRDESKKSDINESIFLCDLNFYENIDKAGIVSCMLWATYM